MMVRVQRTALRPAKSTAAARSRYFPGRLAVRGQPNSEFLATGPVALIRSEGMILERRQRMVSAPAEAVYRSFARRGGGNVADAKTENG
jgi:hypothetical protein